MRYLVYFLFVVWFLSGLGGLLAWGLIRFGPPDAPRVSPRPAWYQLATGLYTLILAAVIFWLYMNESITEWMVLIVGSVMLIPELLARLYWKQKSLL